MVFFKNINSFFYLKMSMESSAAGEVAHIIFENP